MLETSAWQTLLTGLLVSFTSATGAHIRVLDLAARLVLGREDEADVAIPARTLSRVHCRIEPFQGGAKITDLGSSNGTRVNGQDISQVVLRPGDRALLGTEVEVQWVAPGEEPVPWDDAPAPPRREAAPPPPRRNPGPPLPVPEAVPSAEARTPRATETPSGTARSRRRRSSYLPAVLLGTAGVVIVVLFFVLREDPKAEKARALYREAQALQESGDPHAAVARLEELTQRYANQPEADGARELIATLRERIATRAKARKAIEAVLTSPELTLFSEIDAELSAVRVRFPGAISDEDHQAKVAEARNVCEQRSLAYVRGVRTTVQALLRIRDFGRAGAELAVAESSGRLFGGAKQEVQELRDLVDRDARRRFGDLVQAAGKVPASEGVKKLAEALPRFEGSIHEGELRARISLLEGVVARGEEIRPTEPEPGAADATDAAPAALARTELLEVLSKAESLAGRRRFRESLEFFEEAAGRAPFEDRRRIEARRDRVLVLADVVDALVAAMKEQPGAFRRIELGNNIAGKVVDADRGGIKLSLGRDATVRWTWARLTPTRAESLLIRAGLQGPLSVHAATLFLDMGDAERALSTLARRWEKEIRHRPVIESYAAEARRMDAVPPGGFTLHDGRLLTVAERDIAVLVARVEAAAAEVRSAPPGAWQGAADRLKTLGKRGERALADALDARVQSFKKRLDEVPALRPRALSGLRQRLVALLEERRRTALALIMDAKAYPYPYAPNQAEIQGRVNMLVDAVRQIWERSGELILEEAAELKALHDDTGAVCAALSGMGYDVPGPDNLIRQIGERIDLQGRLPDGKLMEHWKDVRAYNEAQLEAKVIGPAERECYLATNEYRIMMGLRAVMVDAKLVLAARGHSQEMMDKGYFSHTSPTPGRESPGKRASLAGWGGGVSENIARGQPSGRAVVHSWCNSSGHHRNILGSRWTHLGAGKADGGNFWTQNFGSGSAKVPDARGGEKKPPSRDRRKPKRGKSGG